MTPRLALLALALFPIGCDRYRSRAQGPFPRQPAGQNAGVSPNRQLAMDAPTAPLPPGPPDEAQPVPPRPPEPNPVTAAIAAPQGPKPPAVGDSGVQQAGAVQKTPVANAPAPPAAPRSPAAPPQPQATTANLASVRKLAAAAAVKAKTLDTYEAIFVRRETLDNATKPGQTEEVILKYRTQPMAVYMKNIGEVGKGREVIYNPSQHGEKVHVIVGAGDTRMYKPGSRGPSMSPDSPLVRSKSRHSIRESGIGISAGKFVALVAKIEAGKMPAGVVKYAGVLKREDFGDHPLEGVEQTVRKGDEEDVPTGGVRHWFFDAKPGSPSQGLPVLVILYDPSGRELEYYRYTQLKVPAALTDADFDPARWGKK